MEQIKRINIPFFGKYEPAMIERYGNSSPIYEEDFNIEMGLNFIDQIETYNEDYMLFDIVDEKKFILAQIRYGF